ncbi:nitroreductase [Parabacteroides sp. PF5-5]|uniref:nitroreductase family protein n=1 Tax=unclassified Parabacteroides TaxID=2649774 RepID=UPI002475A06B|nr:MULTISPECIES: nitroreductase family protein [unclassified Parabacteroides]MDH6304310.1 nitroreductase [Parabacteroides sp. PH5-39]MDH6315537.1 nitroreductase [Parabacteroides sp. PF5-13]MDH6318969.1 nitroreductase [Parabacteroides sp. PH5-13]MDH6322698.1 nitroreductase [Parabacteroides sp. PH5-8]MDH6326730.1 nitroreductase [Parabacteroides sp. PH5-41]
MDDFLSLALQRQSDRAFDASRPVEREKLERILEAARMSPSACNAQPWHFIVVDELELKNKVADATSTRLLGLNHFTKQAPVHIVIVEEKVNLTSGFGGWVKDKNFAWVDIGIAAAHICLAAEDEGLGSCILGWFDEDKMRKLLDIPSGKRILLDVIIGYSTQADRPKKRKETEQVISYNKY